MKNRRPLFIYGASGHAKVVLDIAECLGNYDIRGIIDDAPGMVLKSFMGYPIIGNGKLLDTLPKDDCLFIVGIGSNQVRYKISTELIDKGCKLCSLVHPSAVIATNVEIGIGTVIMAGAVINSSTYIGKYCIINTGACIDHDCIISDGAHISPGAYLAGGVHIGVKSWMGIGSCAIEGIRIGSDTIVGAGSVVINDIPDCVKVVGNPAKRFLKNRDH